jgi:transcription-repair coupling factor (superfamily II helicase)
MRPSQFLFEIPKHFLEPLSKQQRVLPKKTDVRSNTSSVSAEKLLQGKIVLHRSYGVGKIEKVVESSEGVVYHVYFAKDGSRYTFSSEEDALKPI